AARGHGRGDPALRRHSVRPRGRRHLRREDRGAPRGAPRFWPSHPGIAAFDGLLCPKREAPGWQGAFDFGRQSSMTRELDGLWLGRQPYAAVHALQERLFAARKAGSIRDTVLLLEHTPVITYGRGAHAEHVLFPESELARRGVDVVHT